jgi:mono/diheme cytochrome c family protein
MRHSIEALVLERKAMKFHQSVNTLAVLLIVGGWYAGAQTPKTWDAKALADWAMPVAGLNVRPGHFSEEEYYRAPVDNLRTYPVYYPGREPEGYWKMLSNIGPKRLIEPETLKTEADWIRAGARVFEEYDIPAFRTYDSTVIEAARSSETFAQSPVRLRRDGLFRGVRWVPTSRGVALSFLNCGNCHTRSMPDGSELHGAPGNEPGGFGGLLRKSGPFPTPSINDTSPRISFWQAFAVPWVHDDIHESAKSMEVRDLGSIMRAALAPGLAPRWNGSPYYPTKTPDLIGLKNRRYIDHTATHLHRGAGDLMRYAALVTYADSSDFGPHRMLTDEQRKISSRLPDEALYALAQYIYSLEPPANPNKSDPRATDGAKIFEREGCATCHAPPLYTNNKVTPAVGFTPPKEHFQFLDIMAVSVGTDPGLALKTRKGTGYYKVPSLKGVWYRGRYLHDSAVTTLEELLDPARLKDDFVPTGFKPAGMKTRAVKGHEFGLRLSPEEKAALVAFLRTL